MPISITDVSFNRSLHTVAGTSGLGGAIGTPLSSQNASQPEIITGVYISQAFGNALGFGQLSYNPMNQQLTWKPPSSIDSYAHVVTSSGTKLITGANGSLMVSVSVGDLPTAYKIENVAISSPLGTIFDPVTAGMALAGDTQYRCIYFKNNHATLTATDVRLYVHTPPAAPQTLAVGVDPAGVGNGSTTGVAESLASRSTPPAGVTFTAPVTADQGIQLGSIPPGHCVGLWQRRTVPAMAYGQFTIQRAALGVVLVG